MLACRTDWNGRTVQIEAPDTRPARRARAKGGLARGSKRGYFATPPAYRQVVGMIHGTGRV